jgi:hypothetical protein
MNRIVEVFLPSAITTLIIAPYGSQRGAKMEAAYGQS